MLKRVEIAAAAAVILLLAGAVGAGAQQAPAGAAEIDIQNFKFLPETLTVAKGTSVTWVNKDEEPHNVVSLDRVFRSKAIDGGEKFTAVLDRSGTFKYICAVHPNMRGTIVVQ